MSKFALRNAVLSTLAVFCIADASAQNTVEEIIVTATKRAESIRDVPVSVSAISAEQMENLGIGDMEDLSLYVPNFEINSASILPNLYIRGLGSGATHSIEQSVGRFVDGVYISRGAINLHGLMDLDNVEVLRGPQGTLFGKNTVAGALILNTAQPTDTFDSRLSVSASSYSTTGGNNIIQGHVSGPLTASLNGRIALQIKDTAGFYTNRLEGPGGPARQDVGVRMKLALTPGSRTRVGLKYEFNEFEATGPDTAEIAAVGGPPLAVYQMPSPNFTPELDWIIDADCTDIIANRDTTGDMMGDTATNTGSFCPSRDQSSSNLTVNVEYDFAGGTLTAISAYQDYDYQHNFLGVDMGLASAFRARRNEEYSNTSQEIRYTSNESEKLDYIVGGYFENSEVSRFQNSSVNFVTIFLDPNQIFLDRYEPWTTNTQTLAVFGQARLHFGDDLRLLLGGRYGSEDKDFVFERYFADYGTNNRNSTIATGPFGPPIPTVTASRSEGKFTGSGTLQWRSNNATMFYATLAQGHKTGGFSDRIDRPGVNFEYDEENVTSIEFGVKTTLLDGALALNVALFSMDIEGLQLATQLPGDVPAFSVDNAADSTSAGVEFDVAWAASDIWTLGANAAFTDASYDSFPGSENCPTGTTQDPTTETCDLAGFSLIFAPELKYTLSADFLFKDAFGGWHVAGRLDYTSSDEHYTDISYRAAVLTDAYAIANASVRFIAPGDRLTLSMLIRNIGEEAYCAWCIPSGPNVLATMNPPRELALKLGLRF